jgi:hypothetical protein
VTFTLRKENIPQLHYDNNTIPQVETVKYLGLHFDKRLNWKHHTTQTPQPQSKRIILDPWQTLPAVTTQYDINLLAPEFFKFFLAHPVCKM